MDNVKTDDIKNSTALSPDPAEDLPHRRPKRILAAVLAVLLVLGGAAGIYFGTSGREVPEPADEMSRYLTEEPVIGCLEITDVGISIRTAPSADADEAPRTAWLAEAFNVYEILSQDGTQWYRVGTDRWIGKEDAVIYHAGEDASAYPYEKALAGAYRYENTIIRLKDDGSCILRDTAGNYAESTGSYAYYGGNVYLTFAGDSPIMYYARQNGLDTSPAMLFVEREDMLLYQNGGALYGTGYGAGFVRETEASDVCDPEMLIEKYLEAVMNNDDETILSLYSDTWIEISGGRDGFLEDNDPGHGGLMGQGIRWFRTVESSSPEKNEAFAYELKALLEACGDNVSDMTVIDIEACFDEAGTVWMEFYIAETDGGFRIVRIDA